MTEQTISVKVLDRQYNIKCDQSEIETLEHAACHLEDSIKALQNNNRLSFADATLMAALNICGQFVASQQHLPMKPPAHSALDDQQMGQLEELHKTVKEALA